MKLARSTSKLVHLMWEGGVVSKLTTKRLLLTVILGLPELLSEGCARLSISNTTVGVLSEALVSVCVKLHRKYQ